MNDLAFTLLVRLIQLTCLELAGMQPRPKRYPALTVEQLCSEKTWSRLSSSEQRMVGLRLSKIVKRKGLPLVKVETTTRPAKYRFSEKVFNEMDVLEDPFEINED